MRLRSRASITRAIAGRRFLLLGVVIAITVLAIVVTVVPLAMAASSFPDVPVSSSYYAAITDLAQRGIISGYPNGNFGPGDPVTRQQFAKMIVLTAGYPVSEADVCPFTDVAISGPSSLYPDNYVAVCAARGITLGKTATTFDPLGNISRYQEISMVVRMADNVMPGLLSSPPPGYLGSWGGDPTHGANAARAEYNGLLAGLNLAALSPYANMTRGEVAQVLHNFLGKLNSTSTTTSTSTSTTTTTSSSTTTTSTTSSTTTSTTASTTTTTLPGNGYENLGGILTSGPAVCSWASGRLDVFVRATDGSLYHKYYAGSWSAWEGLGGSLAAGSDPAAVSWGSGRIDVFTRGTDNALWHKWFDANTGWSAWESLGGTLTSGPAACSQGFNSLDVFVRDTNYNLAHRMWNGSAWSAWENINTGIVVGSNPAAVSWGPNRIDVFYANNADLSLAHSWWDGAWHSEGLGGTVTAGPGVASWAAGRLDVLVRATDGTLYHRAYAGGWSAWQSAGGAPFAQSDPDAVSWGLNRIDVVVRGIDSALWHRWWNGSAWAP